ncbi:DUF4249 domain-containing protein [Roseivirga sp.]|uniref:DUF4249 domain-containing protein n=1 Tax=Roseivirga sp. TaxID=1964215 RepID=UPI003B51FC55
MTRKITYRFIWLMSLMAMIGCVEPIEFDVPPAESLIIIEGYISNEDAAYTVSISRAIPISADSLERPPVENARVRLYDDLNNIEDFSETSPGIYETGGAIQGEVGRSYYIRIELEDGSVFESEPELMKPVGNVEEIRYEFEARTEEEFFGDVNQDVFNVYIDSDAGPGIGNYVRWRYNGVFRIVTDPKLKVERVPWSNLPRPIPPSCSGVRIAGHPSGSGYILLQERPCTCCECWVSQPEAAPQLSDDLLIADSQFNNIKVGEVPISNITFFDKYLIEVEQMSMTQTAYEFFKLIRIQKTEASNIFQPPSGELIGNIKALNSEDRVVGLFWATAISKQTAFIQRSDVPYPLTDTETIPESCLVYFDNATTTKPDAW